MLPLTESLAVVVLAFAALVTCDKLRLIADEPPRGLQAVVSESLEHYPETRETYDSLAMRGPLGFAALNQIDEMRRDEDRRIVAATRK